MEDFKWRGQDMKNFGQKKARLDCSRALCVYAWQFPTFAWQSATLSSALSGFTSEFGMGSGGPRSLWSPGNLVQVGLSHLSAGRQLAPPGDPETCNSPKQGLPKLLPAPKGAARRKRIGRYMVKPHGQLVHVSCTHYCASTPCLSTS